MNLRLELINTGTELLLGSVINTHLKLLAEELFPLGLRIERQLTVPDGDAIREALAEALERADIILITGGLGPTTDDITRDCVAELLGLSLVHDPQIMEAIAGRFARRQMPMNERVALQALRPPQAIVLPNEHGTAPGLYLPPMPHQGRMSAHIFLLPGPPRELRPMLERSVLPILRGIVPGKANIFKRSYRISGLGESAVEDLVGADLLALGLELGYCARPGEVDVRVIGEHTVLDKAERLILGRLGMHLVSADNRALEQVLIEQLATRHETLCTAESCTGGLLAHMLTNVPGASSVFMAGFVTYANAAKTRDLGVPLELIHQHGAVSAPVAEAMARGALERAGTHYALATTGIAGPGGGSELKPVGTVYIALAGADGSVQVEHHRLSIDRETFKTMAAQTAMNLLRRSLAAF